MVKKGGYKEIFDIKTSIRVREIRRTDREKGGKVPTRSQYKVAEHEKESRVLCLLQRKVS